MNADSEQLMNRFVQGELSQAEESDFLAHCEIAPERYRRATLAIVEQRQLERMFGGLNKSEANGNVAPATANGTAKPTSSNNRTAWLGLAVAAMFAGVLIGYTLNGLPSDSSATENLQLATSEEKAMPESGDWQRTPNEPIREAPDRMLVDDRPSQVNRDQPLPELESPRRLVTAVARLLSRERAQPMFTDDARERLRQGGWEVEEEPQIYLFSTQDGKQFAVPAKNANIRFVKQ